MTEVGIKYKKRMMSDKSYILCTTLNKKLQIARIDSTSILLGIFCFALPERNCALIWFFIIPNILKTRTKDVNVSG